MNKITGVTSRSDTRGAVESADTINYRCFSQIATYFFSFFLFRNWRLFRILLLPRVVQHLRPLVMPLIKLLYRKIIVQKKINIKRKSKKIMKQPTMLIPQKNIENSGTRISKGCYGQHKNQHAQQQCNRIFLKNSERSLKFLYF